jgi:hypothetical protein
VADVEQGKKTLWYVLNFAAAVDAQFRLQVTVTQSAHNALECRFASVKVLNCMMTQLAFLSVFFFFLSI